MSRIGQQPVIIPDGVTFSINSDSVTAKGLKGEISQTLHPLVRVKQVDNQVQVSVTQKTKLANSLHGTFQRLINNMITGVTAGYQKQLELVGTGYRVAKQDNTITLSLGFSHPVEYSWPEGINIDIEGNNKISISGIDKQLVGQVAAKIRSFRPPEPYKGKGIRYSDEVVRRKPGKAAKAQAG